MWPELNYYLLAGSHLLLIGALFGKVHTLQQRIDSDSRFTARTFEGMERRIGADRRRVDELTTLDFRK